MSEKVASNGLKATATSIPDVLLIEPKVFGDQRGFSLKASTKMPLIRLLV